MATCPVCGTEFVKKVANHKFCSVKCRLIQYKKVCEYCGKEFKTQYNERRYCSQSCGGSGQWKGRKKNGILKK